MQKLLRGIVDFRERMRPAMRETFAQLALGQKPDALFIACSDSRVVPNLFASTDPGDLFVVRNPGNLVPPAGDNSDDDAEAAAVEFAVCSLGVRDIVVCGHSSCGAMNAISLRYPRPDLPRLRAWLRHGEPALERLERTPIQHLPPELPDKLSQVNVLLQLEHLLTYPEVAARVVEGALRLHGWWFDIAEAEVHAYAADQRRFVLLDAAEAERLQAERP